MGVVVVTGAAGGIGRATRARLEGDGHRVIGVDVHDAEVIADLASPSGREQAVRDVEAALGAAPLDGVVAGAGVMGGDAELIVSVNHFGAVATLEGLRPLLARAPAPAAVAISSNSTTTQPGLDDGLVEACLAGDEAVARATAAKRDAMFAYGASKLALARWVRRHAVTPGWAGAGITLNAIAPGFIDTPMTEGTWDFVSSLGDVFPIPLGRSGRAGEVAALIAHLLGPDGRFFAGSVLFMDGGTDAAVRPDDGPTRRA